MIASLIIQRSPLVLRNLTPFETVYMEYSEAVKKEKSKGYFTVTTGIEESGSRNTNAFGIPKQLPDSVEQRAPILQNESQYIGRYPDRKVYLLLRTKMGWEFPQWGLTNEDAYKSSLAHFVRSRCLEYFKDAPELYFVGNAPVSHHVERFADRVRPPFSAAHFIYKSQLIQGDLKIPDEYMWATKEEIRNLVPVGFWGSVKDVLSD